MSYPEWPLLALTALLAAPLLQAAPATLSFDQLNQLALQRHPGTLVVEAALDEEGGRLVYEVELHDRQGMRHELELDALSGELIRDRGTQLSTRIPLSLQAGEQLPSWDALNARALEGFAGGRVTEASLRRVGDGSLLYEVEIEDATGEDHELVLEAASGRVVSQRRD